MRMLLIWLVMLPAAVSAQQTNLLEQLNVLCDSVDGQAGIFVKNLKSGETYGVNEDMIFPTASIIKIPIMIGVMDRIANDTLSYHEKLTYRDSLYYAGSDILGSFRDGEEIALDKVMMLMLTMSDNTASLWLQHLAGTGTRINEVMEELGMVHTRMNSRTPGRRGDWEQYGWGQTTPREMATLMEKIWKGQAVSPAASERMLRNLKRNYWDTEALIMLPPEVNTFSKNGAVSDSRSEVVLVSGIDTPYVFCVMTNKLSDTSWDHENEGWVFIRKVSALLWEHFAPSDTWEPVLEPNVDFR